MPGEPEDWVSRLDPATVSALRLAGWQPGRRMGIAEVVLPLELRGYFRSDVIDGFLESFLGLTVEPARAAGPNFVNGEPFIVDPMGVGKRHQDESVAIGAAIGGSWFPIGWWLSYSHVFMEREGALAAYANGLIWSLGNTPDEGLDLMVSATGPLVCAYAPEGMRPWPR